MAAGGQLELVEDTVNFGLDDLGNLTVNNFVVLREIGQGSYGEVFLAKDRDTGKSVALKAFSRRKLARGSAFLTRGGAVGRVANEVVAMRWLEERGSRATPKLLRLLEDDRHNEFFFAMDYVSGGSVMEVDLDRNIFESPTWGDASVRVEVSDGLGDAERVEVKVLSEARTASVTRGLIEALVDVHAKGVAHRDIKPVNILLDEHRVLLCDWGSSIAFRAGSAKGPVR